MSDHPAFSLTRNGLPLMQVELAQLETVEDEAKAAALNEIQQCGFQLDNREPDTEYHLAIGDRDPFAAEGAADQRPFGLARGKAIYWDDASHFDGARGLVWVRLASRPAGSHEPWTPRVRLPVYVLATKLSQARYDTMFGQLRRLAAGLIFDLVSPMLRQLSFGAGEGGVSHRSSQVELRLLEKLWAPLARSLQEVAREPATRIDCVREVRPAWGGERFGARTTAQLAAAGQDPRRPGAARPFAALQERFTESLNTVEHQVIAGLLRFLRQRVTVCAEDIRGHLKGIEEDRPFRERLTGGSPSLHELEDLPRLGRLQDALVRARSLQRQITAAQSLPLFRGLRPRLCFPATPVFQFVRPYRRIQDEFRHYLRSSFILLQDGSEERLKSTQRMYEQWAFFQIAAAFRHCGLQCISQDGLFQRSQSFRYTLDVDRGARLAFRAADGRVVVLRFEAWVLPYDAAQQRGDTLYRGKGGETAWSPDILIEFLEPGLAWGGGGDVHYAVVVDAKYTAKIKEHHWADTRKYLQIRGTGTRRQVVKQLWLAYPSEQEQIAPEDSGVTWTAHGPDCAREEVIEGRLGLIPASADTEDAEDRPGWIGTPEKTAHMFVHGLLSFLGFAVPGEPAPLGFGKGNSDSI